MSVGVLWRLVFSTLPRPQHHMLGPWHPDKARMEKLAEWFRSMGHDVVVQSNQEAGRNMQTGVGLG